MPNVTIYLPKDMEDWLRKQPNKSQLVQRLLQRYRAKKVVKK
jgi:hypothetical protein